ncbi:PH domain-containing protein [Cryobacterium sp. 5I3]|uniref:PH domain-containing protein n=1 Tax=Cryobacterium sp. 5I3 TaxID=3048592 RepID=UPI002B22EAA0|nr:PH domain-containing protein [Cryobacterium sp. 5I3]MEB0201795.1 PH domain-containing protein [Cryobacterium sp. 5I3]
MTNNRGTGPADPGAPAERVVAALRPHGRVLLWPTLALVGVCTATGYFSGNLAEPWQDSALLWVAGAVVVLLWLLPLASWLNRRYTITTRRIIFRRGFFVRTRQELLHSRGYDVRVRTTWLQTLSGSGDVIIASGSERPLVLKDVPNATLVQRVLHDLIEQSQTGFDSRRREESAFAADQTTIWNGR